jgi:MFS family permease
VRRSRWLPDFRRLPRAFWVLFAGTLLNRVGGFVLVFLGIYLTEVRGLTPAEAGYVVAAYGCGAFGGAPLGGALSDRLGRRPPLVASLVAGGASMVVLGFVTGLASIVVIAAATGLLYEMYRPIVSSVIADIVEPGDRPRAYTLNYWAINMGSAIAPPLGAFIAARSYPVLFVADGVTTALYGVLVWLALPETRPASPLHEDAARVSAAVVLGDRLFMTMCVLTFGLHLVFFQAFVALPLDMRAHGISTAAFGALMTINPIRIVLLQPWAHGPARRPRISLRLSSLPLEKCCSHPRRCPSWPIFRRRLSAAGTRECSRWPLPRLCRSTGSRRLPHDRRRCRLAVDCLSDHRLRRVGRLSAASRQPPGRPTAGTHMRLS